MKDRSKPERKEHEQMMTRLRVSAKKEGPAAKVQMKHGRKKIKQLKMSKS